MSRTDLEVFAKNLRNRIACFKFSEKSFFLVLDSLAVWYFLTKGFQVRETDKLYIGMACSETGMSCACINTLPDASVGVKRYRRSTSTSMFITGPNFGPYSDLQSTLKFNRYVENSHNKCRWEVNSGYWNYLCISELTGFSERPRRAPFQQLLAVKQKKVRGRIITIRWRRTAIKYVEADCHEYVYFMCSRCAVHFKQQFTSSSKIIKLLFSRDVFSPIKMAFKLLVFGNHCCLSTIYTCR